jgi:hypothetical protein
VASGHEVGYGLALAFGAVAVPVVVFRWAAKGLYGPVPERF